MKTTGIQELSLPSLKKTGSYFIYEVTSLVCMALPNLSYGFVGISLDYMELPSLTSCNSFLFFGSNIKEQKIDNLVRLGDRALSGSKTLSFNLPYVEEV